MKLNSLLLLQFAGKFFILFYWQLGPLAGGSVPPTATTLLVAIGAASQIVRNCVAQAIEAQPADDDDYLRAHHHRRILGRRKRKNAALWPETSPTEAEKDHYGLPSAIGGHRSPSVNEQVIRAARGDKDANEDDNAVDVDGDDDDLLASNSNAIGSPAAGDKSNKLDELEHVNSAAATADPRHYRHDYATTASDGARHYDAINSLIESPSRSRARLRGGNGHGHANFEKQQQQPTTTDWCSVDCSTRRVGVAKRNAYTSAADHRLLGGLVCGSDGRLYRSECELKREACRKGNASHLFRVSTSYCQAHILQTRHWQTSPAPTPPTTSTSTAREHKRTSSRGQSIESGARCQINELATMKLELLRHFNADLESMFRHFDSNGDQLIEARELWPRLDRFQQQQNKTMRLMYAQIWDDHLSSCPREVHHWRHNNKCWYQLDFAFEPAFPRLSPCSLSHLMLLDLAEHKPGFTFELFNEAFKPQLEKLRSTSSSGQIETILIKSRITLKLGASTVLNCMLDKNGQSLLPNSPESLGAQEEDDMNMMRCMWTRFNFNLASVETLDSHLAVEHATLFNQTAEGKQTTADLLLRINEAQLYLSGQYKCSCHLSHVRRNFVHLHTVQVVAEARVSVRPKTQWSLPGTQVAFECQQSYVDTQFGENLTTIGHPQACNGLQYQCDASNQPNEMIRVDWFKDELNERIVDSREYDPSMDISGDISNFSASSKMNEAVFYNGNQDEAGDNNAQNFSASAISARASIAMASSKLTIENVKSSDSGSYICGANVDLASNRQQNDSHSPSSIFSSSSGKLLIRDQPPEDSAATTSLPDSRLLWMFHDNGISIYRLQNDDSQEMELVREINGHSLVDSQVDGNWNQLTLCGGLNQEQVVICEWSDNAIYIDVALRANNNNVRDHTSNDVHPISSAAGGTKSAKYVYVGQPNLNRVIVMDGGRFEIVAIINTEPQPRKLFSYKPNKIHLSKWVRRRLSPTMSARWLSNGSSGRVHPLSSSFLLEESQLYSNNRPAAHRVSSQTRRSKRSDHQHQDHPNASGSAGVGDNLVQHDIWLLCYGQPLVLDPSGDEHLEEFGIFPQAPKQTSTSPLMSSTFSSKGGDNSTTVFPFTPRLSPGRPGSYALWPPIWPQTSSSLNGASEPSSALTKESRLRNRKTVHIIQSTFFPHLLNPKPFGWHHRHHETDETTARQQPKNDTVVGRFKRATVITTHHVLSGPSIQAGPNRMFYRGRQFDLIQDLNVPPRPYPLELEAGHKIHYAYITHYDEKRLFRVSMDEYHYDKEIDLQDCDPTSFIVTAQGQLVIQCRSSIAHNLIGQLVLDQLTNSRIEFNANVRAQEAFLSPDHRYLVSIYGDTSQLTKAGGGNDKQNNNKKQYSIIYVQLVTVSGLKLQYEIKTSLEICQCSFVWKDGYYAAIFVSTNHRDQQSEILNLRLADGRLELMARVPGTINMSRHKDQLLVSSELRVAALSTNQGTFVVDLEDNRVSQSLRHHQSPPPTLLWV